MVVATGISYSRPTFLLARLDLTTAVTSVRLSSDSARDSAEVTLLTFCVGNVVLGVYICGCFIMNVSFIFQYNVHIFTILYSSVMSLWDRLRGALL